MARMFTDDEEAEEAAAEAAEEEYQWRRRAAAAAAAAKRGQTVPPLPAVVCGETCWARKGVWCCRSK